MPKELKILDKTLKIKNNDVNYLFSYKTIEDMQADFDDVIMLAKLMGYEVQWDTSSFGLVTNKLEIGSNLCIIVYTNRNIIEDMLLRDFNHEPDHMYVARKGDPIVYILRELL